MGIVDVPVENGVGKGRRWPRANDRRAIDWLRWLIPDRDDLRGFPTDPAGRWGEYPQPPIIEDQDVDLGSRFEKAGVTPSDPRLVQRNLAQSFGATCTGSCPVLHADCVKLQNRGKFRTSGWLRPFASATKSDFAR
jgi:hypothetical protein